VTSWCSARLLGVLTALALGIVPARAQMCFGEYQTANPSASDRDRQEQTTPNVESERPMANVDTSPAPAPSSEPGPAATTTGREAGSGTER
jgi:hypothetical protein